jgi:hypothetical protein
MLHLYTGKPRNFKEVVDREQDLLWLDLRDAAQAFCRALACDRSSALRWAARWAVYHIGAPLDNPKFLISHAEQIGYQPTHNFQGRGGL